MAINNRLPNQSFISEGEVLFVQFTPRGNDWQNQKGETIKGLPPHYKIGYIAGKKDKTFGYHEERIIGTIRVDDEIIALKFKPNEKVNIDHIVYGVTTRATRIMLASDHSIVWSVEENSK